MEEPEHLYIPPDGIMFRDMYYGIMNCSRNVRPLSFSLLCLSLWLGALLPTARRAKRENGGLGEDPPESTMTYYLSSGYKHITFFFPGVPARLLVHHTSPLGHFAPIIYLEARSTGEATPGKR
jgi:hypothetical protein